MLTAVILGLDYELHDSPHLAGTSRAAEKHVLPLRGGGGWWGGM